MSDPKSPFARLAGMKGALPPGPAEAEAAREAAHEAPPRFPGKIVIARSRKGRGGKTVTVVTGIDARAIEAIAKELRHALGCGAIAEDGAVVIQGEQHERVRAWLEAQGATRIVIGS